MKTVLLVTAIFSLMSSPVRASQAQTIENEVKVAALEIPCQQVRPIDQGLIIEVPRQGHRNDN